MVRTEGHMVTREATRLAGAEQRLKELGITLPAPPEPFGAYVEAVQTGNLLFLSGMLPTEGHQAKVVGRVGAELDVEAGRQAARLAALNVLAVARQHLGSLDKVTRVEPLPPGVWCRQPSARRRGGAGSHFRGRGVRCSHHFSRRHKPKNLRWNIRPSIAPYR